MLIPSPLIRRLLLYGVLASFLHLSATWIFGLTDRFAFVREWLMFSGMWRHRRIARAVFDLFPAQFESFYDRHGVWFHETAFLANSALWGFAITATVLYIHRRILVSQ